MVHHEIDRATYQSRDVGSMRRQLFCGPYTVRKIIDGPSIILLSITWGQFVCHIIASRIIYDNRGWELYDLQF